MARKGMDKAQSNGAAGPDRPVPRATFVVRGAAEPRWREALADVTLRPEPPRETRALLLDSFDRRLQNAGIALTARGEAPHVRCRIAGEVPAAGEIELERRPAFAWDLPRPHGPELARALEARSLEPVGEHATSVARAAVLDEHRKVVAWIEEEQHRVRPSPAGDWSPPARRVVLRGVRGYGAEFERLVRVLKRAGLRPGQDGEFDPRALLPPPPRRPGRWPTLAPGIHALAALARIARAQLSALEANEAGMRAGRDAEHLHDARVALRRLRSLLGQLGGILETEEREHLVQELRWLAGRTGPARDLDTLLFELRLCEPELRAELAPLVTRLERLRAERQAELVRELDSARFAELCARLRAAFAKKGTHGGPRAAKRFARVVQRRLRRRLAQVVAAAERLGPASPPVELHELRITCKKLRYLLECCRGLVPGPVLARPSGELKRMQEVLGTIQDTHVQAALVNDLALELAPEVGPRELLPLGRFQERILQRSGAARTRFAEVAAAFLSPASQAGFAELLRALGGGGKRAR